MNLQEVKTRLREIEAQIQLAEGEDLRLLSDQQKDLRLKAFESMPENTPNAVQWIRTELGLRLSTALSLWNQYENQDGASTPTLRRPGVSRQIDRDDYWNRGW